MTTLIILISYIASIFISRYLYYIIFRLSDSDKIGRKPSNISAWLIPGYNLFVIPVYLTTIICLLFLKVKHLIPVKFINWFTGKNWEKKSLINWQTSLNLQQFELDIQKGLKRFDLTKYQIIALSCEWIDELEEIINSKNK